MSIQFKPKPSTESEYEKRSYLMVKGIKEGRADLASNYYDLKDLDKVLAKEGEE
jgi:hypothetical protein